MMLLPSCRAAVVPCNLRNRGTLHLRAPAVSLDGGVGQVAFLSRAGCVAASDIERRSMSVSWPAVPGARSWLIPTKRASMYGTE